jgi:hypothetical protein
LRDFCIAILHSGVVGGEDTLRAYSVQCVM